MENNKTFQKELIYPGALLSGQAVMNVSFCLRNSSNIIIALILIGVLKIFFLSLGFFLLGCFIVGFLEVDFWFSFWVVIFFPCFLCFLR